MQAGVAFRARKVCRKCRSLICCLFYPYRGYRWSQEFSKDPRSSLLVATKSQVLGCGFSSVEAYWKGYFEVAKASGPHAPDRLTGSIRDDIEAQAKTEY